MIMALVIFIAIIVALFFVMRKVYQPKPDTCLVFTGGLGSGKSLVSVQWAKKLLRKNRFKVRIYNLFHKEKREVPLLYSTIPVRISRKEWSVPLEEGTPCLKTKIVPRSVVFIDEVSLYIDQMTVKFNNSRNLEEWSTLFRHYTKGGYLVLNTQNTSKVNFHLRYCLNRGYNLCEWRHIWRIYWVKCRDVSLVEDVKSVSADNLEDNYRLIFGWLPFRREYDTYVYSERVQKIPEQGRAPKKHYKTNTLVRIPEKLITPDLVTDDTQFSAAENKIPEKG